MQVFAGDVDDISIELVRFSLYPETVGHVYLVALPLVVLGRHQLLPPNVIITSDFIGFLVRLHEEEGVVLLFSFNLEGRVAKVMSLLTCNCCLGP